MTTAYLFTRILVIEVIIIIIIIISFTVLRQFCSIQPTHTNTELELPVSRARRESFSQLSEQQHRVDAVDKGRFDRLATKLVLR